MEAIFLAKSDRQKLTFYNTEDLATFCGENDGQDIIVSLKPKAKASEKTRLYAFYHGPLLHCAMIGYTFAGWEGLDKVKVDYLLRAEFAKDFLKRPDGSYQVVMLDKKRMTKNRFLKYVQDCLFFIENELKQGVPDSEEYKASKGTGHQFTKV